MTKGPNKPLNTCTPLGAILAAESVLGDVKWIRMGPPAYLVPPASCEPWKESNA